VNGLEKLRAAIAILLFVAIVLSVLLVILLSTAQLLSLLGDHGASRVLGYVGLGLGIIWLADLLFLLGGIAFKALMEQPPIAFREPPIEEDELHQPPQ